jgi:hypothetical protein
MTATDPGRIVLRQSDGQATKPTPNIQMDETCVLD